MATLEGKKIVVIGGTSGIGYAVAKGALLSLAEHVFVASSSPDRVKSAVSRLGAEPALQKLQPNLPRRVSGDVVDMANTKAIQEYLTKVGEIDHLVITSGRVAGMLDFKTAHLDNAHSFFDDRFWGATVAAQSVKLRAGGSITFTIGTVLHRPMVTGAIPTSMAGAIDALTRALAVELAPIRVNNVAPGAVETELWDTLPVAMREKLLADLTPKLPVKHVAGPDEIAEAYLFLMKCNYITGQRIDVEGGILLV